MKMTHYITKRQYNEQVSADGACYGDLLDYQNIDYVVIDDEPSTKTIELDDREIEQIKNAVKYIKKLDYEM